MNTNLSLLNLRVNKMPVISILVLLFLSLSVNFMPFSIEKAMNKDTKPIYIILFYIFWFVYFIAFIFTGFVIYYYYVFTDYTINISQLPMFAQMKTFNDQVSTLLQTTTGEDIIASTQQDLNNYSYFMLNSSVYGPLSTLKAANDQVENVISTNTFLSATEVQDLYTNLYNIIQSVYLFYNQYEASPAVENTLQYLVFQYLDYYKNNYLPMIFNNLTEFTSSLILNFNNQIGLNNISINYDNKSLILTNTNTNNSVFTFNPYAPNSYYIATVNNGTQIQNVNYTAAVSIDSNNVYVYYSSNNFMNTNSNGFSINVSNTNIDYSAVFAVLNDNNASCFLFDSNVTQEPNIPTKCFFVNNFANNLNYNNIACDNRLNFEFVNYNAYEPVLLSLNDNNQVQWIIQDEFNNIICVVNKENGVYVAYFAISDTVCARVTMNLQKILSQEIVFNGIDFYIWNVI